MIEDRIILGIDPGTTVMGYGLIEVKNGKLTMLNFGIIQLNKLANHPEKLKRILDRLNGLIEEFHPDEMAIEAPFFGKNVQSMLKLGRAQGVILSAGLRRGLSVAEYSPAVVKRRISGRGAASKEQLSGFLHSMFAIPDDPKRLLDATDALAVAACHALTLDRAEILSDAGAPIAPKKSKAKGRNAWSQFLAQNPDRSV